MTAAFLAMPSHIYGQMPYLSAPQESPVMRTLRTILILFCLLLQTLCLRASAPDFSTHIQPFLTTYCLDCHGKGEKVKGKVDFTKLITTEQLDRSYETWAKALELLQDHEMPPEEEPQPTDSEREVFAQWYQHRFVDTIQAEPGRFQPRRLSAVEYRNTLRSLFGFDLEVTVAQAEQTIAEPSLVLAQLPTDPPGHSGFTNDTHGNPLSTEAWNQYAFLTDVAIDGIFSDVRRDQLEAYTGTIDQNGLTIEHAATMLRRFIPSAWRRPQPDSALQPIIDRVTQSSDLTKALKSEIKVALMSPPFLYRGLLMDGTPGEQQPVDDYELAERLSYFICGDMPDAELTAAAQSGRLQDPIIFAGQIDRLLTSPGARNLAENFAVEWLALDEIDQANKNPPFMLSLKSQPIDFMHYLFTEARPLTDFIDSRVTYANNITAGHYGKDKGQMEPYHIPKGIEVMAMPNQRITLNHTRERGGILTMPGILAMNKGPVIRGTWILERILGDHLPEPPMNVGVVPGNRKGENLSFRERFEQHRSNKTCAVCHDKIDPLGFALQRFNDGGGFLKPSKKDPHKSSNGGLNTQGQLPSGEAFEDVQGLKQILVTSQRPIVIGNLVKRTLSYALCRKLEVYDQPTVAAISTKLLDHSGTFRDLVHEVAHSLPFRETTLPAVEP
jgi:hypothetical protein